MNWHLERTHWTYQIAFVGHEWANSNDVFNRIQKRVSPQWWTAVPIINTIALLVEADRGIRWTSLEALGRMGAIGPVFTIPTPNEQQWERFKRARATIERWRANRWWMLGAFVGASHNCTTFSSTLLDARCGTPDRLYQLLKNHKYSYNEQHTRCPSRDQALRSKSDCQSCEPQ